MEPLAQAPTVSAGVAMTPMEQDILAAVRDRSRQLDEQGLYVMLRRAACLPQLTDEQYESLSQIAVARLLGSPQKLRGEPTRLRMIVVTSEKWDAAKGLGTSRWWPRDRAVWWMTGFDVTGNTPSNEPVAVISLVDPQTILGKPLRVDDEGMAVYPIGKVLQLAGVFYKVYTADSRGDATNPPRPTDYPLIVAWQLKKGPSVAGSGNSFGLLAILLGVLVLAYVMLRRKAKAVKAAATGRASDYRPPTYDDQPPTQEPNDIDPELKAAAEELLAKSKRRAQQP